MSINGGIVGLVTEVAAALPEGYRPFHPALSAHVHDEVAHWIARVQGPNGVMTGVGESPAAAMADVVAKVLEAFNA